MTSEQMVTIFLAGMAATLGTFVGLIFHKRIMKKDCSDCGAMNAVLEAVTVLIMHSKDVPEDAKCQIQKKLTVPGL